MRVLYITPTYYPRIGGVEYVVKSVAERLAKRGHDVTVLAGEPELERPAEEEVNGVHVVRWPTWAPGGAYHIPRRRIELEKLLGELARRCDVAHIHSVHTIFTVYAGIKLARLGTRVVVTPHYHGTGHTPLRRVLWLPWRHYVKKLLTSATVHSVSKYEASLIQKHYNTTTVVIEHGVEEIVLKATWRPDNYVMYSGRIEKYKNIHKLAKIVKILNAEHGHSLSLKIFGEGPYKEKLRKELEALGVEYEMESFKPYEEYVEALSRARLFALLSQKEAYGQTINEANAIGVPAIAATPWGQNFSERPRTLIVDPTQDDRIVARKVAQFLETAQKQPRPQVPSWDEVVTIYTHTLYRQLKASEAEQNS